MKNFLLFASWQWNKWKAWQKVYALSMISVIIGVILPGMIGAFLIVVGLTSLLSWMFKWAIWDSISDAYEEFKKEKENEQN